MRTSAGLSRATSGDNDIFLGPVGAWSPGGLPGVLFCHGANQTCYVSRATTTTGQFALTNALGEAFSLAITDTGGTAAWGNNTSIAAVGQVKTWLQGTWGAKAGKVALVGVSMGAVTALNYARANPTLVSCVVVCIPVIDLNDIVVNNRGSLAASVNTAYGGTYNDGTDGPTHSPAQYAASFTVPTLGYYSSDDTTAIASAVTTFDTACAAATFNSVGALGHSEAAVAAAPTSAILDFIWAHA